MRTLIKHELGQLKYFILAMSLWALYIGYGVYEGVRAKFHFYLGLYLRDEWTVGADVISSVLTFYQKLLF